MKKVISLIVATMLLLSSAALADWNVQNLTEEELIDYRRAITDELASRHRAELQRSAI